MIRKGRYRFLDTFKGAVLLLMIEGHTVRALLSPALQATEWFRFHEIIHNITGPAFLLAAGFSFALPVFRHPGELSAWTPRLIRRFLKMFLVIFLGYALNVPYFSMTKSLHQSSPAELQLFFSFGILQCIGFSHVLLQGLFVLLRGNEKRFLITVAVLGVCTVVLTPFIWTIPAADLPAFLAPVLSNQTGSHYPFFPNAAFLLGGILLAWGLLRFNTSADAQRFMALATGAGAAAIAGALLFELVPFSPYPVVDYWFTSPNFFLIRFGILLIMIAGSWFFVDRRIERRHLPEPVHATRLHPLETLGQETLIVYIVHLPILFGWVLNAHAHLSAVWGGRLDALEAAAVVLVFSAAMFLLAWFWNRMKTHHPVLVQGFTYYCAATLLYYFITNPW